MYRGAIEQIALLVIASSLWSIPAVARTPGQLRDSTPIPMSNPTPCEPDKSTCFILSAIIIDGATVFSASELAESYKELLGHSVSTETLKLIADRITGQYRAAGYFLSRAIIPVQNEKQYGIVHLRVIEGRFAKVQVEGTGKAIAEPYLDDIDRNSPADLFDLDRRLARAITTPGLEVKAHVEPDLEDPESYALVIEANVKRVEAFSSINNRGSHSFGPWLASAHVNLNSVLSPRDQFGFGFLTVPSNTGKFTMLESSYTYTFTDGTQLISSATSSRARDGYDPASQDVGGDG